MLPVSVNFEWPVTELNVCSAFLHGELKENVFMCLLEICSLTNEKVCKLKKAIYV